LKTGYSTAIKTGLNQTNIVAVVAYNDFFYVYINGKFITSLEDKTFNRGSIGAAASSANTPAEVVFRNAKVWTF
jgi:eukaryotic-like serine/threonine-protein kinase